MADKVEAYVFEVFIPLFDSVTSAWQSGPRT
jgi:hypothetical protein